MFEEEDIAKAILRLAETPERAREITAYISSLNWDEIYDRREKNAKLYAEQKQREAEGMIANGGGYCDECGKIARTLHTFPHRHPYAGAPKIRPNWPGKYCLSCIGEFQDICDIPRMDRLCRCNNRNCLTVLPRRLLVRHEKIEKGEYSYCQPCMNELIEKTSIICEIYRKRR